MLSKTNDLEILFSPSHWSNRYGHEEVLEKHVEFLNEYSKLVRESIPCELNITYGTGDRDKYDLFGTDLKGDSPLLIHIHGGYYQEETVTHSNNDFIANAFYKSGIKTILIGYVLAPNRTVIEILENLQIGLQKCVEYAKSLHCSGIYLSGHSAGAHALATIFTNFRKTLSPNDQELIKAAFLISGVYDFEPVTKMSVNALLNVSLDAAQQELSPLFFCDLNYGGTEFYIIVGENDSPAFIRQSRKFHLKLLQIGVCSKLEIIPQDDHFNIIENLYLEESTISKLIINAIK